MQRLRRLNGEQVRDISRGAAVLGTGGGGDPYLGTLSALGALEEYGSPEIIEAHEVPDDGLVALPVLVGAPVAFLEKFPIGPELESAYRALDAYLEGGLVALMSAEMGGANSVVPLILGARLGVPVVDADAMGRAYPEVQLVT